MSLKITTEEFLEHVPANASFDVARMGTDLLQVQDDYLHIAFGEDFYEDLCSKYEAGTATPKQTELVAIIRSALANLAQASFLPIQSLQLSDRGAHIVSTETEKTAFEHQTKAAQASFQHKGFQAIERALRFLERNIDDPDFVLWATSEACTRFKQHTLSNADEFNEHYSIGNSRRTYMALLPTIRKVEDFFLVAVLGEDFWYQLKEQLKDRDVSLENQELLNRYIRPAVAHLAVANADSAFCFADESLLLRSSVANPPATGSPRQVARVEGDGKAYLAKLKTYLNVQASPLKYATYYNSSLYEAPGYAANSNGADTKVFSFL